MLRPRFIEESLSINGYVLSNPPLNPSTNAFNGTNSFTGESNLHNMDIDVYDIQNTITVSGYICDNSTYFRTKI